MEPQERSLAIETGWKAALTPKKSHGKNPTLIQSVSAIQSSHVQVLIWGTRKGAPVVNLLALASKQAANMPNAGVLDFQEDTSGLTIHSMDLEEFGLLVEFDQNKTEGEGSARGAGPANGREAAKGGK